MKKSQKISVILIVLLGIVILTCFLWNTSQNKKPQTEDTMAQMEGKSVAELNEELAQLTQKQADTEKELERVQQEKQVAKETKAKLKQMEKNITTIKDEILDIQKKALYIGKFTCKVNTCQTNPKDENYPVFLSVTKDLENAKQALFDAQAEYDKAKKICAKDYDSQISTIKEKIQAYDTQQKNIKEYIVTITNH